VKRSYVETVEFLFSQLPVFQRDGAAAYKPGLETTLNFCAAIGNPHLQFKSIHVGGTNGKGSSSHSLASILHEQGYKTGLYTSPHLLDFRERIRINGEKISEIEVVDAIKEWLPLIKKFKPTFFELTVALAFDHFARHKVDIAVIEVGMGGRLDSTNIIRPLLSLITNISLDHQFFLGETHELIAREKAGIIKSEVPIVVSERQNTSDFAFVQQSEANHSDLQFASDLIEVNDHGLKNGKRQVEVVLKENKQILDLELSLTGLYQLKNIKGVIAVCFKLNELGIKIEMASIQLGVSNVQKNTGLLGRWQILGQKPLIICDTAHNEDGVKEVATQLLSYQYNRLWLIWGMVSDKEHKKIVDLLPTAALVVATQPSLPRALPSGEMAAYFRASGFITIEKKTVQESLEYVLQKADKEDLIFVGGSTFTVADIPFEKYSSEF